MAMNNKVKYAIVLTSILANVIDALAMGQPLAEKETIKAVENVTSLPIGF